MSAIAGIVCFDGKIQPKAQCQRMLEHLSVYGRDGSGLWDDARAALGVCKMRVLVEDEFDRQPLVDAERGLALVADARIDNREELAQLLNLNRAGAALPPDSHFILAAYDRWDRECCNHIVGRFTFAIWDARRRRLFCGPPHN